MKKKWNRNEEVAVSGRRRPSGSLLLIHEDWRQPTRHIDLLMAQGRPWPGAGADGVRGGVLGGKGTRDRGGKECWETLKE